MCNRRVKSLAQSFEKIEIWSLLEEFSGMAVLGECIKVEMFDISRLTTS